MTVENKYPTDEKTLFLICEDCREEKDGKFTLVGFIPQAILKLEGKEPEGNSEGFLSALTIFMSLQDGEGEFSADIKLLDPAGANLLGAMNTPKVVEKKHDGPMNLVVNLRPLKADVGKYEFIVKLDNKAEYHRFFELTR